jgi:hypothetical protein
MAAISGSKTYIFAALGVGFVGALFSLISAGSIFSLLGGFMSFMGAVMAALFWKYGYMVIPMITQRDMRSRPARMSS